MSDADGGRIDRGGRVHKGLHVDAPGDGWAELGQRVQGVGNVVGAEGGAVTPGDAVAQLDGELGVVLVELPRLGEPGDGFIGERAIEGEWLEEEAETVLMAGADQIFAPELLIDKAAGLTGPTQNEGFFSRDVGDILRGHLAERADPHELGGRGGGGGAFREGSTREFERVQFRH